jgi:dephospho-CoA kinase
MSLVSRKLIGITGGIGSGKSMVSRFWSSYRQLPLVDVDELCAGLLTKGNVGWQAIRQEFGSIFFNQDNQLDRKGLRTAIFSDSQLRLQVNDIIHPLALAAMVAVVKQFQNTDVLVDVPLLFEAGWGSCFDHRVVVFADEFTCCRRIVQRDNIASDEARQTVLSQIPIIDKVMSADHVINNSGPRLSSMLEIIHLARLITPRTRYT